MALGGHWDRARNRAPHCLVIVVRVLSHAKDRCSVELVVLLYFCGSFQSKEFRMAGGAPVVYTTHQSLRTPVHKMRIN